MKVMIKWMPPMRCRVFHWTALALAVAALLGCGGGGAGGSSAASAPAPAPPVGEKPFILDTVRRNDLFPEALPAQVDLNAYATPGDLLEALVHTARQEGKDRWSAVARRDPAQEPQTRFQDRPERPDIKKGFGFRHALQGGKVFVTDVLPGSGAAGAGLRRGDEILGTGPTPEMSIPPAGIQNPAAFLYRFGKETAWGAQPEGGAARYFRIRRASGETVDLRIAQRAFNAPPVEQSDVLHRDPGRIVGYLRLRQFHPAARQALFEAFARFKREGVTDLVLDLRYNPGGDGGTLDLVLDLLRARPHPDETMYRLLGAGGRLLERHAFSERPESIRPRRIAVIVTGESSSSSEALANVLAPYYHRNLALVGARTGGKPVGMLTFPIPGSPLALKLVTARIVNMEGMGDYYQGLPYAHFQAASCAAEDDPAHAPGDPAEASTRTALEWILHGTVPHGPIR